MSRPARLLLSVVLALGLLAGLAGTAAAHRGARLDVVASGLDNPRGLDVGRDGAVYVTEAGRGGAGPCVPGPEGMGTNCLGATGAVTRIGRSGQRRVLTGLPSLALQGTGGQATGPQDIALGRHGARLVLGLGGGPALRAQLGALGERLGWLVRVSPFGRVRPLADLAAYEAAANPDGGEVDSNPNSVETRHGRSFVADAGGNDLLRVRRRGAISTLAVFPDRLVPAPPGIPGLPPQLEMQAVPTSVVVGPDGALYVGQLTGVPFPVGAARVYRVVPGSRPEVFADGFTNVTDIAFGRDGSLYVLEIAANGLLSGDRTGALIRVRRSGSRETVASAGLEAPTGLAIDRRGAIYVSNRGDTAGTGQVVRVRPGR